MGHCSAGGIDKIGSFITLFGCNKLHIAVFTDFHDGDKKKIRLGNTYDAFVVHTRH